jgi:hypothetical protein
MYPFKRGPKKNAPTFHFPVDDNEFQFGLPDSSIFFVRGPIEQLLFADATACPIQARKAFREEIKLTCLVVSLSTQRIHREKIEISRLEPEMKVSDTS